ncbi:hypothetical protein WICMUC_001664 [Wickerhamomyces mucosus]|uniref:Uncharacterized protein n=1 Tax=Wickerhamomyces mucosus TaxID=1378264 RepID=A0A9P8PTJ4_9ASCO|nr:hypothetical protein WICMUC_001664 [Wickerhamomyces mucosus]
MVSETDVIRSFLLERINFQTAMSQQRFANLFPKSTPVELISQLRKRLIRESNKNVATVERNLANYESITDKNSINSEDIEEHDVKKLNDNLVQISKILDTEILTLQDDYQKDLKGFKTLVDQFDDVLLINQDNINDEMLNLDGISELLEKLKQLENDDGEEVD